MNEWHSWKISISLLFNDYQHIMMRCRPSYRVAYVVCSVPQGSVLGPRNTADLADVTERHGVTWHAFADDTELYLHCRREYMASSALHLDCCLSQVGHWMSFNRLKLNAGKTELPWAGSRHSNVVLYWATAAWHWNTDSFIRLLKIRFFRRQSCQ